MEQSVAPSFAAKDLQGMKFFKPMHALLKRLHGEAPNANRKLYYDHYISLMLLYFFNPIVGSLRDIQRVSDLKTVAKKLGVRRASLGSLSEASHVFDPDALKAIFFQLAQQAGADDSKPRPKGVPEELAVIAADGTLLDALPKMVWAYWLGEHDKAVKVHLQFDVLRSAPADAKLTEGNGSEIAVLKSQLKPGNLYLVDRGYTDYALYQSVNFLAQITD